MVRVSRRHFTATSLAGVAALAAGLPVRRAVAAEFVFKLGTNVPENHPLGR
jgi:TRAP-type transport system periplasmic protein